jgi:hypothetical protein
LSSVPAMCMHDLFDVCLKPVECAQGAQRGKVVDEFGNTTCGSLHSELSSSSPR